MVFGEIIFKCLNSVLTNISLYECLVSGSNNLNLVTFLIFPLFNFTLMLDMGTELIKVT